MLSRRGKWDGRGGNSGFERHLLTRSDPRKLFVLANSDVCVKVLHCYLSEKTTTTVAAPSYGTQSVKRITTTKLSRIAPYRTNTAETLVLELTFCVLRMVECDLVHQYHIDQTVNKSSSVTMGQSFASYAKCTGYPASYQRELDGSFPEAKRAGREADH